MNYIKNLIYKSVFDEIYPPDKFNRERSFSFSIPSNDVTLETPSSLPNDIITTQELTSQNNIEDDDYFWDDEVDDDNEDIFSNQDDDLITSTISQENNLDYTNNYSIQENINNTVIYRCPLDKSHDAYKIWKAAKIPKFALLENIEYFLLKWANTNASLTISDNKIVSITWISESKYKYTSTWSAFLRWFICSSSRH